MRALQRSPSLALFGLLLLLLLLLQGCSSNDRMLSGINESRPTTTSAPVRAVRPRTVQGNEQQRLRESLEKLVAIAPEGEHFGYELRRLADLELEASIDNRLSENPAIAARGAQESARAIQRYEHYLYTYPDRADNDLVLYQLARAYAMESQPEKAEAAMEQLSLQFPQSRYSDEIQFRRGETLFSLGDYLGAEVAYGVVVNDYPNSIFFEKSLFKYGWSRFKQSQNEQAIDSFVRLLDIKQSAYLIEEIELSSSATRAEQELLNDVARVISLSFSYLSDKLSIGEYFKKAGKRDYEPFLYSRLADLYMSKERFSDAADVYLSFGQSHPYSPYTPLFHGVVIEAYQKAGFISQLLPEKERFVMLYNVGSEFWERLGTAARSKMAPILKMHLYDIATHYHSIAGNSRKPQDYALAASWYQRFLAAFPEDSKSPRVSFLMAESLFEAGQNESAIEAYETAAYGYPTHEDSREAGFAVFYAYEKQYQASTREQKVLLNKRLIKSSLRYSDKFPNDSRLPAILLNTAENYYFLSDYLKTREVAQLLITNVTTSPDILNKAWTLMAHSAFEAGDFVLAEKSYLKAVQGLANDPAKRRTLIELLASSIYRQGEKERSQGNHQLAAEHFLRVAKVVPDTEKRILADYDAATEYMVLQKWQAAIILLEKFRRDYPVHTEWELGVSQKLALAYSSQNQPIKAAGEMLKLAVLTPESEQDLLWQAAELYQQAGQPAQAMQIYKSYIVKFPRPLSRTIELRNKLVEYYATQNDSELQRYWLDEIIQADENGGSQRTDRTRFLAASATLQLVKPVHQQFSEAKLTIPLSKSLKVKQGLMKQSIEGYTRAARYQIEQVTTASTHRIAEIYREFASAILKSERPKDLNQEELEEYNYLLEEQAYPFEEKAIKIYESNLLHMEKGSFDESIKNSLAALARLLPYRYSKNEVIELYVE